MSTLATLRQIIAVRLMTARRRIQAHDPVSTFQAGAWTEKAMQSAYGAKDEKTMRQVEAIFDALNTAAWKQRSPWHHD